MCSTIRPYLGAHCFGFLQPRHFCKAPISSSHEVFVSSFLLTAAQRFGGPKCA